MEQIMNYVKPELIVVAVVLYFIGMGLKHAQAVKDKYIPLILGGLGIVLCAVWVFASCPVGTRAGDRNGSIHGDYTGNFNSRIEYIRESDHETDW